MLDLFLEVYEKMRSTILKQIQNFYPHLQTRDNQKYYNFF